MNTGFWNGVLTAQSKRPIDLAVGCPTEIRHSCLRAIGIGGWGALKEVLAEGFSKGCLARVAGYDVRLGTRVVVHRIDCQELAANLASRPRWSRTTGWSLPVGYFGEIFANPLPWAIALAATSGRTSSWTLFAICISLRLLVLVAVGWHVIRDRLVVRFWWLAPLQDFRTLVLWVVGSFGNRIVWKDRMYKLSSEENPERLVGCTGNWSRIYDRFGPG